MSGIHQPVEERDLHAYVDGQLELERLALVEQHLIRTPADADRVAAYQAQRHALRAAFSARIEPLPPALSLASIMAATMERRVRRGTPPWLLAASVVFALGLGIGTGWILHGTGTPSRTRQAMFLLEQEALASHVVYSRDQRHPIEVSAAEEPHLKQWLSKRLNRTIEPPDLSGLGYRLIGGRLLATEHGGAAALFIYDGQAAGTRLSLLIRPMAPELRARQADIADKGANGLAWIDSGLGIAVIAAAPESEMARIARHVGEELGIPG